LRETIGDSKICNLKSAICNCFGLRIYGNQIYVDNSMLDDLL